MKLSRVEIQGFKSFAQRTELSFDSGITGIVGPNGSGKSNIADAVRWVLGEQSAKILRGAKMEDVIFNGTQTRKPLPYCEVSLQFDNEDKALNSPYSEVLVTRRVYRSGDGEYFLNRVNCRLRDVLELFRDTGIGKEGYSIIGQGRIEEILSTKGDERRQVFEEAAGIVTFRVRKEEAERKLSRTRENLLRVNDLIEEISARLGPLEEQSKTAQEYLALSTRQKYLDINVYLIRHDRLQARLSSLRELTQGLQESIQGHEEQMEALGQQRAELERLFEDVELEDREARQALNEAQEAHFQSQRELQALQNRLETLEGQLIGLSEDIEQEEKRLTGLQEVYTDSEQGRQAQLRLREEADSSLRLEEELLESLLHDAQTAEHRLDEHKSRIIDAITRLSDAKSMQARQQAMQAQMSERFKEIRGQKEELSREEARQAEISAGADRQMQAAQDTLAQMVSDAMAVERRRNDSKARHQMAAQRAADIAGRIQADQNRLNLLEDLARDYEGYNHAVKKALHYAAGNPRVHGVIAQLIKVPREYETALDMILGGTLQHIVTDDEETAKSLIEYLRNNRLGRTTFLPISAIRGRGLSRDEQALLSTRGCIGVASDLIEYDRRLANIIESILGRTVIVEDMDAGIALSRHARQAFNVVTLAGDVLRAGGAMTGGTSQSRASSLLGREREISELKAAIAAGRDQYEKADKEKQEAELELRELTRLQSESTEALSQHRILAAREQERSQNALRELNSIRQRRENLEMALGQLEQSIAEIESDLQAASEQTQSEAVDQKSLEQETQNLQQQLMQARGKAERQRELVTAATARRSDLTHQHDLLRRDRERWANEIRTLEASIIKTRSDIERLKEQEELARGKIEAQEEAVAACSEQVSQRQNAWDRVAKKRNDIQTRQKNCSNETERLHVLHAQDSDKLYRNELVCTRTEGELQAFSDYIFNSYELTYALAQEQRAEGKFDLSQAELEIKSIKQRIREMGSVNVGAVEEYAQTRERYDSMIAQRDDAQKAERDLVNLINQLLGRMETQFVEEFAKLNSYFSQTFTRLFGGGKAELILSEPAQPLTCDIEVAAQPPGKKLQLLSLLSGGEKALTAIAILFAMLKLKPTPFCILDEIEAALDEANISYFAEYLAEYAKSTQFIIITHRKGTMECCDALYGVAMEERGVSGMVSVNLQQYTEV